MAIVVKQCGYFSGRDLAAGRNCAAVFEVGGHGTLVVGHEMPTTHTVQVLAYSIVAMIELSAISAVHEAILSSGRIRKLPVYFTHHDIDRADVGDHVGDHRPLT